MALKAPPAFISKIEVGSSNNTFYWREMPSTNLYTCTLSSDTYSFSDIASALESGMNGAGTHTYTVTFDKLTGKISISATGDFIVIVSSSDSDKIGTGGDTDSNGSTLLDGQVYINHIGFPQDDAFAVYTVGSSMTAPLAIGGYWRPTYPPTEDNEKRVESVFSEAISLDGTSVVFDYTASIIDRSLYDSTRQAQEFRDLSFSMITQESRDQYLDNYWMHYAKQGNIFFYYEDPNTSDFKVYRLTGESLSRSTFQARKKGLPRWSGSLKMKREVDS